MELTHVLDPHAVHPFCLLGYESVQNHGKTSDTNDVGIMFVHFSVGRIDELINFDCFLVGNSGPNNDLWCMIVRDT
jgi:hypothetical protein